MASLMVRTDNGIRAEGVINERLRIKPLLEMARSDDGRIPHMLFEAPPMEDTPPRHRDYKPANLTAKGEGPAGLFEERSSSRTYYPEIHIVQDYAHAKVFGFRKTDITTYFAVLCNAINVRYKRNRSLKIQLRIVAITMSTQVEEYFVYADRDRKQILDEETLEKFYLHYQGYAEYIAADLTFLVTGLDMVFYENQVLQTWVGGYSYVGGFCQTSKVGMCEDPPGSYFGASVFAHEIGHSLGCAHDGSSSIPELPGHKGSVNCPWSDGFMMSYEKKNENQYKFSQCCIDDIKNLLRQPGWSCLMTRQRKSIKRQGLPGNYISGKEYCRRCYPTLLDMEYNQQYGIVDCKVRCEDSRNYYLVGVPDGTPCDKKRRGKKRCVLAKCVRMKK
ncbi:venom metalloproteinase antarease-like TtrivMP_A [Rhipicephalus sanguineus]|uniref:venom metalloproteinase antarease-like TtrivMP_A n=1 Tax=Rhipicephalus sanguineus TaxID=34632 RepID=UPI001895C926|nr:venom metalloproteinase antarease-like TtrivMP_A [Rhipicephalus sanguineus]